VLVHERDADPAHAGADLFRRNGRMRSYAKNPPDGSRSIPVPWPAARINEVMEAVGRALDKGKLVYWIVPLVEESETVNLTDRRTALRKPARALRRQGRPRACKMRGTDKDRAMAQFAAGETGFAGRNHRGSKVGVDVPAATIMVIEKRRTLWAVAVATSCAAGSAAAPRHRPACCFYKEPLGEIVDGAAQGDQETTDGFRIAEEDLKLRGEGDVLGVRQSGLPGYRIARTDVHGQLITQARDEALRIMKDNPKLEGARGEALRALLYLFRARRSVAIDRAG